MNHEIETHCIQYFTNKMQLKVLIIYNLFLLFIVGCNCHAQPVNQVILQGLWFYETALVLSFGIFCFTKKDDKTFLLRIGGRVTSRLGSSNERNDITALGPSTDSCQRNNNKHSPSTCLIYCIIFPMVSTLRTSIGQHNKD